MELFVPQLVLTALTRARLWASLSRRHRIRLHMMERKEPLVCNARSMKNPRRPNAVARRAAVTAVAVMAAAYFVVPCILLAAVDVIVTPNVVDAGRQSKVVVAAVDPASAGALKTVDHATVDGVLAQAQVSDTGVTVALPVLPAGNKTIRLLDASETTVAEARVEYRASETGNPTRIVYTNWFYLLVTLLFGSTVLPFTVAIMTSVWRGASGQSSTSPLGLPVGTVRAVLAFCLVVYLGLYVLASVLSLSDFKPPDFLTGIVATVIGFYFGSRNDTARPTPPDGATGTPAGGTGGITGRVLDAAGSAAPNVTVVAARSGAPATDIKRSISDADGRFSFSALAPGMYTLTATSGTVSATATVTTQAAGTVTSELKLA